MTASKLFSTDYVSSLWVAVSVGDTVDNVVNNVAAPSYRQKCQKQRQKYAVFPGANMFLISKQVEETISALLCIRVAVKIALPA